MERLQFLLLTVPHPPPPLAQAATVNAINRFFFIIYRQLRNVSYTVSLFVIYMSLEWKHFVDKNEDFLFLTINAEVQINLHS